MSRVKQMAVAVAVLAALPVLAFLFTRFMAPPAELDLSRDRQTANGLYRVTVAPEREPFDRAALHSWIVTVATPGGAPVAGATVSVDGGMPQHGHGLPTAPAVTGSVGAGRYRVEGVRFNMGGTWEFRVLVAGPLGQDSVTFNLDL